MSSATSTIEVRIATFCWIHDGSRMLSRFGKPPRFHSRSLTKKPYSVHASSIEFRIAAKSARPLRQPLKSSPCDDGLCRPMSPPGQTENASLDSPRHMPRLDLSVRRLACLGSAPISPIDPGANRIRRVALRTWSVFRGLSYVGIRASSRQVLPRRLEPILSWVFTSLGLSPFLP